MRFCEEPSRYCIIGGANKQLVITKSNLLVFFINRGNHPKIGGVLLGGTIFQRVQVLK